MRSNPDSALQSYSLWYKIYGTTKMRSTLLFALPLQVEIVAGFSESAGDCLQRCRMTVTCGCHVQVDKESNTQAAERKVDVENGRMISHKDRTDWLALAIATEPFLERYGVFTVRRTVELVTYVLWDATVVLCGNGNECGEDGVCVHPCLDSRRLVVHLESLNVAAGHALASTKLLPNRGQAMELARNLLAIRDLARTAKVGVMRTPFMCWILNRAYICLFVRLMFLSEHITGSQLLFRLARPYAESQAELVEHDRFSKFGCRVSNVEAGWRRTAESRRIIGHRFCSPLGITQRLTHPGAERLSKAECQAVARKLGAFSQAPREQMREEAVQGALLEVAGVLVTHLQPEEVRLNARLLGAVGPMESACTRLVAKADSMVGAVLAGLVDHRA